MSPSPKVYLPPPICPILSTFTPSLILSSVEIASNIIKQNGLVAFPTETVYGLGANALNEEAVSNIFKSKGRPSDNPLIVHISSMKMLSDLIPGGLDGIPTPYIPLMKQFWPGPLSFIFSLKPTTLSPPKKNVAKSVRAGVESLAIRMPSHSLALELIKKSNLPLAAPSANLSSRPSPTSAQHVFEDLGKNRGLGAILDGGNCNVGVESTVIDYHFKNENDLVGQVRILRAGGISAEEIENCLNQSSNNKERVTIYSRDFKSVELEERPTTPGMKYKHYSPSNSTVTLIKRNDNSTSALSFHELLSKYSGKRIGLMLTTETLTKLFPSNSFDSLKSQQIISYLPNNNEIPISIQSFSIGSKLNSIESAQSLFAGLRFLDQVQHTSSSTSTSTEVSKKTGEEGKEMGVEIILLECIEEIGVGLAFMERARKAAGTNTNEIEFKC